MNKIRKMLMKGLGEKGDSDLFSKKVAVPIMVAALCFLLTVPGSSSTAPVISSVTCTVGVSTSGHVESSTAGGKSITITGTHLDNGAVTLTIGGVSATATVVDDNTITCTTPAIATVGGKQLALATANGGAATPLDNAVYYVNQYTGGIGSGDYTSALVSLDLNGVVSLTAPVGTEVWNYGSSQNITWASTGVSLQRYYSTNGGSDWTAIGASVLGSSTPSSWTVNAAPGVNTKIKIENAADASQYSISPAVFTVAPTLASVTSNATGSGWLIIGNSITFTATASATPVTTTGISVSGSYNNQSLTWSTANSGASYTATYNVTEGHTDQTTAAQISNVDISIVSGGTTYHSYTSGTDVAKKIDANKPTTTVAIDNASYSPQTWVAASTIKGTASDAGSGVASVTVAISNGTTPAHYWDGTAGNWNSTSIVWNAVTSGTTSWTYTLASTNLSIDKTYTVQAKAIDTAGNEQSTFGSDTFTYAAGPVASLAFTNAALTTATAGVAFSPQPQVTLYDADGNICTNAPATSVTLFAVLASDGVTPATGTLANATQSAAGGVVTFANVSYSRNENIKLIATVNPRLGSAANVNKYLIVRDTAGKTVQGWIKAQGTGESLGNEVVTNWDMEAGDPPTSWPTFNNAVLSSFADERPGGAGTHSLNAVINGGASNGGVYRNIATSQWALYYLSAWLKNIDGDSMNLYSGPNAPFSGVTPTLNTWTNYTLYFTAVAGSANFGFLVYGSGGKQARMDDFSYKQVLAPATSGAIIVNSSGGTAYSWIKDSGFAANNASGYTYELYNSAPTTVANGTVTYPNMKISSINGAAFVDFTGTGTNPTDLTNNTNKFLIIRDSTGKAIKGWIKAAGTGETYNELITPVDNRTFASNTGWWNLTDAGMNIANGVMHWVSVASGMYMYKNVATAGMLVKTAADISNQTAGTVYFRYFSFYGPYHTSSWSGEYGTMDGVDITYRANGITTLDLDNVSAMQVLTPSTTGATIVTDAAGATYNWTSQDTGFHLNDTNGYTYAIYSAPPAQLSGSVTLANAKLSLVDGTAFADFGGVPVSSASSQITMAGSSTIAFYTLSSSTPQIAGTGWPVTITAYDQYGNVAVDSSTVVTMSTSPTGTTTFYTSNNYGTVNAAKTYSLTAGTTTAYIKDTAAETITITATDANSKTGSIANIVVNSGAATNFVITGSATQVAGATNSITITAKDANGNICSAGANNYTGAQSLTFSGSATSPAPASVVPTAAGTNFGTATSVTFTNGVASAVAMILYNATETQPVSISATASGMTTSTPLSVTVSPASVASLTFNTQPATTLAAGVPFSQQPVVKLYDQYGNLCTNDTSTQITLSAVLADGITPGTGALSGTITQAPSSNGTVTYSGISYSKSEAIKLVASSLTNPTLASNVNKLLVVNDGSGRTISGWIKAAGTGETYNELLTNGDFSSATGWILGSHISIPEGGGVLRFTNAGGGDLAFQSPGIERTKLYKTSFDILNYTSGSVQFAFHISVGAGVSGTVRNSNGTFIQYTLGPMGTPNGNVSIMCANGPTTLDVDNFSVKQVLAPSTTGATIVSAQSGTVYNWANQDTGFTLNNSAGYTYQFYAPKTYSATQANTKISAVNGTAFVDFSGSVGLTPYLGKYIVVTDSAGKQIKGYIKQAGTGETLEATERATNGNFDLGNTSWAKESNWDIVDQGAGNYEAVATNAAVNTVYQAVAGVPSLSLFKVSIECSNYTSGSVAAWVGKTPYKHGDILTGVGTSSVYWTENSGIAPAGANYGGAQTQGAVSTLRVSTVSFKQVLAPATTGVTIASDSTLATQNWESKDAAFNYNDTNGYTCQVYDAVAVPPTSGAVTRANMKLSLVDGAGTASGGAFVDFSEANKLTPYIGKYLIIKDSAGKMVKGYIKAAGTGETLGSEFFSDPGFDNPAAWSVNNSWSVANSVATGGRYIRTDTAAPLYKALYKFHADVITYSSGRFTIYDDFTKFGTWLTTTGNVYVTHGNGHYGYLYIFQDDANAFSGSIDNVSFKQVLTPSTTGVTIVDAAAGTNYNWASQDSGFNANDTNGYSYEICDSATSVNSVTQANAKLSIVNGAAFADLGASAALNNYVGKYLVIKDSTGKQLTGYIKQTGIVETYGNELVTNRGFDSDSGWTKDAQWSIANGVASASSGAAYLTQNISKTSGVLYKLSLDVSANSNYFRFTWGTIDYFQTSGTGTKTAYLAYAGTGLSVGLRTESAITIDNYSVKQVLTPGPTGVTIVSTAGGNTYNWAVQESGFSLNDANGYTFGVYDNPAQVSGSVARSNIKLSLVDTTAFVDFSTSGILTSNIGKYLVVKDSSGNSYAGWIKAAGTGETLGSDFLSGLNLNSGWSSGGVITIVDADTYTTTGTGGTFKSIGLTNSALYKVSYARTTTAASAILDDASQPYSWHTGTGGPKYTTAYASGSFRPYFYNTGAGQTDITLASTSFQQVLTPATTGATIVSTSGGTTQNWAVKGAGFNPNDSSGYTYQVYDSATPPTVTQANGKLSLVNGTAFADFGGVASVNSSSLTPASAAAASMVFTQHPSTTGVAGAALTTQPVIKLYDSFGNLCATDNTTSVTLSAVLASDGTTAGTGTLSNATAQASGGIITFNNVNYTKVESIQLKATSGALPIIKSNPFSVLPAAAYSFTFTTQPATSAVAGVVFTAQPVVQLKDQYTNICTNDNTTQVTLSAVLASNGTTAGGGTLGGTLTQPAVSGIATFSGLSYTKLENIQLKASSGALTTNNSNTITMNAAPVASLTFDTQPATTLAAGVPFSQQPIVKLYDAYNNLCTNDSTTQIVLSAVLADGITPGTGALGGTITKTAAAGTGTVTYTDVSYSKAEQIKLTASSLTNPTLASNVNKLLVVNDGSGRTLSGWVKAAGTGETYGSNLATNSGMETGNPPTGWIPIVGTITLSSDAHSGSVSAKQNGYLYQSIGNFNGKLLQYSGWLKNIDAGWMRLGFGDGGEPTLYVQSTATTWTNLIGYATSTGATTLSARNAYGTQGSLFDDLSAYQVLTPSTTGATIVTTQSGTVYNWANQDNGFTLNNSAGYTYAVYAPATGASTISIPPTSGAVTQANMKLSLVAGGTTASGGAFVDFSQAGLLTPYVGKYLVIKDSAGKMVKGYIKAAGTGETLGSELFVDPGFDNSGSWTQQSGWTVPGGSGQAVAASTPNSIYQVITQSGRLQKVVITCSAFTSGSYQMLFAGNTAGTVSTSVGAQTYYRTEAVSGGASFGIYGAALTASFSDISSKPVLRPSITGVTIVDATGTNYNWQAQDSGFNANDTNGYSYEIRDTSDTTVNSVTQANAKLSIVNGAAFADFGASAALNNSVGKYLVIKDSKGKQLTGYIKQSGVGEVLGSNLITSFATGSGWNATTNSTINDLDTFTTTDIGGVLKSNVTTAGGLYKTTVNGAVSAGSCTLMNNGQTVVYATNTGGATTYRTSDSDRYLYFFNSVAAQTDITMATTAMQQVLSPGPTGVTIVSTPGGNTQNWASVETGFKYSDANGYTFGVYDNPAQVSGSTPQANTKLSLVDGAAFVDFSRAGILTSNIGKYLVVKDSSGISYAGWIKAAGTGETYLETCTDPNFSNASLWMTDPGWSVPGGGLAVAASSARFNYVRQTRALTGQLIKYSGVCSSYTQGAFGVRVADANAQVGTGTGTYAGYFTASASASWGFISADPTPLIASFSSYSAKQVLTPSTTGVTIVKASSGADNSVQNWVVKGGSFNLNDSNGYTYQVYDSATPPTVTQATAKLSLINGTAFADFGGVSGVTSSSLTPTSAQAAKLAFTSVQQTLKAGEASAACTVKVLDTFGNLVTDGAALTLVLQSTSGQGKFDTSAVGAFNGTVASVATSGGIATFYYKDTLVGTPVITVSNGSLTSAKQQETINVADAAKLAITSSAQTLTAGVASSAYTVQVQDAFGNLRTADGLTLGLASDSTHGTFDANNFIGAAGTGSVTQANTKLSLVNTVAFVDFSTADKLTPYVGKYIVITDSAGKQVKGWIKAQGTGETYNYTVNGNTGNGNMETGDPPTGWAAANGATISSVADERTGGSGTKSLNVVRGTNDAVLTAHNGGPAAGCLVKFGGWIKNIDATSVLLTNYAGGPPYGYSSSSTSWASFDTYFTSIADYNYFTCFIYGAQGKQARFDDLYLAQVLAPAITGVTIASTSGLSDQNWASQDAGFNPNSSTYTYQIYDSLASGATASIMTSGGIGTFYYKDTFSGGASATSATPTITVSCSSPTVLTSGTQPQTVNPNVAASISVTNASQNMVAGTRAQNSISRFDAYGNLTNVGTNSVLLATNSPAVNAKFYSVPANGTSIPSVDIAAAATSVNLWYYDEKTGNYTITASLSGTQNTATYAMAVKHAAPDHLKFSGAITPPSKVNVQFTLPEIQCYDQFNNVADNTNSATAYNGAKTLSYILSGLADAPNGSSQDNWTTAVTFSNTTGKSTTTLNTTLYRAQTTTITAVASDLSGGNIASDPITINPDTAVKLGFAQEPSLTNNLTNVSFATQPQLSIRDTYGNQTPNTYTIKIDASATTGSSAQEFSNTSIGTLTSDQASNQLVATAGLAAFSGVKYDAAASFYLYGDVIGHTEIAPAFSHLVAVATAHTTTVEVSSSAVADFYLIPTNDNILGSPFSVIGFKIHDNGTDQKHTLIDQLKITIGGDNGLHAANDISGATLYKIVDSAKTKVADATAITNTYILFGLADGANGDNAAALADLDIPEAGSRDFVVDIYMKHDKLLAKDHQTYTFGITESNITVDGPQSSGMSSNSAPGVPTVVGTLKVDISNLEVVNMSGTSTATATAGSAFQALVRATDANKNIDLDYTGNHTLIFTGLNSIGSAPNIYIPKVYTNVDSQINFGNSITLNFNDDGTHGNGAVVASILPYKKEAVTILAQESGQAYTQSGLVSTVSATTPTKLALATLNSGNNQTRGTSRPLDPFLATVSDTYGNPAGGEETTVNFAIATQPTGAGATLSRATDTPGRSGVSGEVSTVLTLGSISGAYKVRATCSGLTGSPLDFDSTALAPGTIQVVTGADQSAQVNSPLGVELRIKIVDSSTPPLNIANQPVTFTISSVPAGAIGQKLQLGETISTSQISTVTDANGAGVYLTLGQKSDTYKVTVSSPGTNSIDFTATAMPNAAVKVAFAAPLVTTVNAGVVSSAFTIATQDEYGNNSKFVSSYSLASSSATGKFYSVSNPGEATQDIHSVSILSGASTASFWYKDTATGSANITVLQTSTPSLTTSQTAVQRIDILPGNASRFTVSGTDTPITTGGTKALTLTLYDNQNPANILNNYTDNLDVTFSGASVSPAATVGGTGTPATCLDRTTSVAVPFGAPTSLHFENGVAHTTATFYAAESVTVKATSGSVTTSDNDDVSFIVKHGAANHLKFSGNLPASVTAGHEFSFGTNLTLQAVDLYNNPCDGANSGPIFSGDKDISWAISGTHDGPEGAKDYFIAADKFYGPTVINFNAGASTSATPLIAKLYYAQITTITASCADLQGTNIASNPISVVADASAKLRFIVEPSGSCVTSQALAVQPQVAVSDQYGNPVAGALATVSLSAYLNTSGTAATHTLSAAGGLSKATANGIAIFSGVTYNYPEDIFLRASISGLDPVYSSKISFATAQEASITRGATNPASISSLAITGNAANVLDFTVADAGNDGFTTKVTKVIVKRDTADNTGGWAGYLAGASITDGVSTPFPGIVEDNQITFDGLVYSVANSGEKTFTISVALKSPVPAAADGKILAFKIDPALNITLDAIGSRLGNYPELGLTAAPELRVIATDFKITGSASMNAGASQTITIKAVDALGNIDSAAGESGYNGGKSLTFSGATASLKGNAPTAATSDITFGQATPVTFTNGSGTTIIKLYNAETAIIKATDGTIATATKNALSCAVSGGTANSLVWSTQPVAVAVENAPWQGFSIALTDAYGNTSPNTANVTITPSGGDITAGATATAQSGVATFYDFAVNGLDNGAKITINAVSGSLTAPGASNEVTVYKNYNVTITIKDYTSGSEVTECTINATKGGAVVAGFPKTGNSPFTCTLPYGTYVFTVTKDQYVDTTQTKIAGVAADYLDAKYDAKIAWTLTATSVSEATSDYNVKTAFVYDESSDKLTIRAWLERRGMLISGDSVNSLGAVSVRIQNDSVTPAVWYGPITITNPTEGIYTKVLTNIVSGKGDLTLASGRTYYAKLTLGYGGEHGDTRTYEAGATFSVTVQEALKTITSAIQAVTTNIAGQTTEIKTVVKDEIKKQVEDVLVPKITDVKNETAQILTAASETIPSKLNDVKNQVVEQIQPSVKSGILTRENTVKQGGTLAIRYRAAATGLSPVLNVYSPKNTLLVANRAMKEVGATGVYEASVTFATAWGTGDFSVICSEAANGTADALVITVVQTDIDTVSGNVAAVLGNTGGISNLKNVTSQIGAQFNEMDTVLAKISKDIAGKLGDAKGAVNEMTNAFTQLEALSKQIKSIGGTTGINLEKLYEVSKDKQGDITYIKNKSEELKAAMEINQKMIENVAKKPVVQTWFEFK